MIHYRSQCPNGWLSNLTVLNDKLLAIERAWQLVESFSILTINHVILWICLRSLIPAHKYNWWKTAVTHTLLYNSLSDFYHNRHLEN